MEPKPTQFKGYTKPARIEIIMRMTDEDGEVEENRIDNVSSVVSLVRLEDGDVRTVMIGDPRAIYAICTRSGHLIEKGLEEIMRQIKNV